MRRWPVFTLSFNQHLGPPNGFLNCWIPQPDIASKPGAPKLPEVNGRVHFDNITFNYNDRAEILNVISALQAEPGQIIALVGPSGAGKTTMVNLIPRFYDVLNGRILIDDHDIRDIDLESLRQQIGIVPQETILFSDSRCMKIFGTANSTPPQEEIEAAAKAANAHDFIISELPDGYEHARWRTGD